MPVNVLPFESGKRAMSRGKLTMATLPVSGSTLTTSRVSVSAWLRVSDESMPVSRKLMRDSRVSGVATGVAT